MQKSLFLVQQYITQYGRYAVMYQNHLRLQWSLDDYAAYNAYRRQVIETATII